MVDLSVNARYLAGHSAFHMVLTLSGFSTALYSTWWYVDELAMLFDAGDGVTSGLLQRSRRVKHVFISHADRDHLAGLLQFNQLNARDGFPIIHYPRDCGSFPALAEFTSRFDPQSRGTRWQPVTENGSIRIGDILVETVRNGHVVCPAGVVKSMGFRVWSTRKKLRPELAHLSGDEIKRIAMEHGRDSTTEEVRTSLISYSGDTPVEDPKRWDGSAVLIHEATFLHGDQDEKVEARGNRHSSLEEVMEMVSGIQVGALVLGHFSPRYSPETIDRRILGLCEKHGITAPVHRVLPGQTVMDILGGSPLNA